MCGRMLSVTVVRPTQLGGNVTSVGVRRQEPHNRPITYASVLWCTRHSCHGSSGKVRV